MLSLLHPLIISYPPLHWALGSGPQSHFASATQATFLEPKVVLYAEGVHLSRGTVKFRK